MKGDGKKERKKRGGGGGVVVLGQAKATHHVRVGVFVSYMWKDVRVVLGVRGCDMG